MSESIEDQIVRIVNLLDKVADHNGDTFKYRITIDPSRPRRAFSFEAVEMADGHIFAESSHATLQGCLDGMTEANIEGGCKAWGYEMPQA